MSIAAPRYRLDRIAVFVLLAFVAAANLYRAATQSIVYDEAAAYINFVRDSVLTPLKEFNAANHVLFSALAAISTHTLGPSEFTLRLPSVLGAIGYLAVVYKIARQVCGGGLLFVATVAALSLNPVVFDFMSAARGYGLALFWFCLGLLEIVHGSRRSGDERTLRDVRRHSIVASIALGLAVCSNLAFLFPVTGLLVAALAVAALDRTMRADLWRLFLRLSLPGAAICVVILVSPLRHARRDLFFFGADGLFEAAVSLVNMSLEHHPTRWTATGLAESIETALPYFAAAVVFAAIATAAALAIWRRDGATRTDRARLGVLLGATWAGTLVLLLAAHRAVGLPYPLERTGLYLIPLFIVTIAAAGHSAWWPIRASATAVLFVLTLTSAEQFTLTSYASWRFDAGSREVARVMASAPIRRPLKVATSQWLYQPALEYYRLVRYPDRFVPIVEGFDLADIAGYDFLVVTADDDAAIDPSWRRVYTDPLSDARVLANPGIE